MRLENYKEQRERDDAFKATPLGAAYFKMLAAIEADWVQQLRLETIDYISPKEITISNTLGAAMKAAKREFREMIDKDE